MGLSLAKKTGQKTDLQYIISGKYLIFYRQEECFLSIIRIIDGRTDYLRELFH